MGCLGLDSMAKLLISLLFGGEEDWFCIYPLFAAGGSVPWPTRGGAVQISGRGRASSRHHCPPREYSNGVESGPGQASEPAGLLLARLPARPGLRTGQDSAV